MDLGGKTVQDVTTTKKKEKNVDLKKCLTYLLVFCIAKVFCLYSLCVTVLESLELEL